MHRTCRSRPCSTRRDTPASGTAAAPGRLGLALAALLALALGTEAAAQGEAPPVTAAKPVVKEIVEDDEFVGRFDAEASVVIRARVSGYLDGSHFTDGAEVEAGQLLFTIDSRPFDAALRQAEAAISVAEATFTFTQDQLARAERLVSSGNIAQSVVDERRERFLAAQGEVERARAALEGARIDLGYTEIRAPIAGVIGRDLVTAGNLVRQNETELTSIVSLDPIYFYFDIDERYFLAYARDARARGATMQAGAGGLKVKVTLADGTVHEGELDFAENRLDEATGTMRVRAVLANPDGVLQPGLFGRVNVPGSLPYRGVLVPDEAILADQNRRIVMTLDASGTATARPVRPGPRIDGYRVIREGLDGSETIVIEGLLRARPGAVVAPTLVELPPVAE